MTRLFRKRRPVSKATKELGRLFLWHWMNFNNGTKTYYNRE